jgi:hypothetical protein
MNASTRLALAPAALALCITSDAAAQTTYAPTGFVWPTQVNSITSGDLGGWRDVVITRLPGFGGPVEVYRNAGSCPGLVPFPVVVFPANLPRDAVVADYDGDLDNDILVAEGGAGQIALHARGIGYAFAAPVLLATSAGFQPIQILADDWNDDGTLDIAALCDGGALGTEIELWRGTGGGAFALPVVYTVAGGGIRPRRFASGCIDSGVTGANNLPDCAVALSDNTVRVLRNQSTSVALALGTPLTLTLAGTADPRAIAIADFDGNGFDDIATANHGTNDVAVFWHQGWTPGFPGTLAYSLPTLVGVVSGAGPVALTRGDLDCDGDQDLALVCDGAGGSMHCLWNQNGFGSAQLAMSDNTIPSDIETTDLDEDGELDLITCSLSGPDYVKVFCNQHPPGRCCHVFRAGVADAYATSGAPVPEHSCPRPALAAYRAGLPAPAREFDDGSSNRHFAHSFEQLPGRIVTARLIADVRMASGNANDGFHIGFDTSSTNHFLHADLVRSIHYAPTGTGQFTIDLADLPGGLNLLPNLNATRVLDVYCQDDTDIDFLRLELETCCEHARPDLSYDHTPLVRGQVATFSVTNGPVPGVGVFLMGTQLGCAGLPTPLENICLLPLDIAIVFALDGAGNGSLALAVPLGLPPCLLVHTQGLAFDVGTGALRGSCTISDYLH